MVNCTGRGLVVKRPGVLSKVQMLTLVLGVGVFPLLPTHFGAMSLLNCTAKEKHPLDKIANSSGKIFPKLRISVPCRRRICPEREFIREFTKHMYVFIVWTAEE